jgi:hypothetical protein
VTESEFITLQQVDGRVIAVVSRESLALYAEAAEAALWFGQPGCISDLCLSTLDVDTTTYALELEMEGLWLRIGGGYRMFDLTSGSATSYRRRLTRAEPDA